MKDIREQAEEEFNKWFQKLPYRKENDGPARGDLTSALVVLERLREECDFDEKAHRTKGGAQVRGLTKPAVSKILERLGETRTSSSEAGRTNRGALTKIGNMLQSLKKAGLGEASDREREAIIDGLQRKLLDQIVAYHNRQRLKLAFDSSKTTRQVIADLLSLARESGKDGPVAQYLVGAKLALRFPALDIGNESYSTADVQLNRPGDFYVGDTVLHVTISPQPGHYEKCRKNLDEGYKVYLLVPDRAVIGARQNVENMEGSTGRISVESIESFVAQNLDELAVFSRSDQRKRLRELLDTYNRRVGATENDKSMLIDLPGNL